MTCSRSAGSVASRFTAVEHVAEQDFDVESTRKAPDDGVAGVVTNVATLFERGTDGVDDGWVGEWAVGGDSHDRVCGRFPGGVDVSAEDVVFVPSVPAHTEPVRQGNHRIVGCVDGRGDDDVIDVFGGRHPVNDVLEHRAPRQVGQHLARESRRCHSCLDDRHRAHRSHALESQ